MGLNLDWEKAVINEVSWLPCLGGTGCVSTISCCWRRGACMAFQSQDPSGSLQGGSHFCSEWAGWRSCSDGIWILRVLLCRLWNPGWVGREQNGNMYEGSLCFLPHCPLARRSASTGEGTCQAHGVSTALQASGLSAPASSRQFQ